MPTFLINHLLGVFKKSYEPDSNSFRDTDSLLGARLVKPFRKLESKPSRNIHCICDLDRDLLSNAGKPKAVLHTHTPYLQSSLTCGSGFC